MSRVQRILDQLASWKNGYIAPSAAILMDEARMLIEEQENEIQSLIKELEELKDKMKTVLKANIKKNKTKDNDQ